MRIKALKSNFSNFWPTAGRVVGGPGKANNVVLLQRGTRPGRQGRHNIKDTFRYIPGGIKGTFCLTPGRSRRCQLEAILAAFGHF